MASPVRRRGGPFRAKLAREKTISAVRASVLVTEATKLLCTNCTKMNRDLSLRLEAVHHVPQFCFGRARKLGLLDTVDVELIRRHSCNAAVIGGLRVVCHINLEEDAVQVFSGKLLVYLGHGEARPTPGCVEIHNHEFLCYRSQDLLELAVGCYVQHTAQVPHHETSSAPAI